MRQQRAYKPARATDRRQRERETDERPMGRQEVREDVRRLWFEQE